MTGRVDNWVKRDSFLWMKEKVIHISGVLPWIIHQVIHNVGITLWIACGKLPAYAPVVPSTEKM
jgi:hypothetical protein